MRELVLKNLKKGIIYIHGDIDERCHLSFATKIRHIPDNIKDVIIYIHSDGGSIDSGLAIIDELDLLRSRGKKITGVAVGKCLSVAVLILVYCDSRFATPNTTFLLHQMSYEMQESTHSTNKAFVDYADKQQKDLMSSIAIRCNRDNPKDLKKFIADCDDDLWLTSENACDFGIIEGMWDYSKEN